MHSLLANVGGAADFKVPADVPSAIPLAVAAETLNWGSNARFSRDCSEVEGRPFILEEFSQNFTGTAMPTGQNPSRQAHQLRHRG